MCRTIVVGGGDRFRESRDKGGEKSTVVKFLMRNFVGFLDCHSHTFTVSPFLIQ